ncbi:MAG: ABC transporter substrate-binding protein [Deltaproteobacteria bacterium]|nr:MAG: ABC transporter substrate-binding protein [Deltaproteobacteria bacterium]
MHRLPVRAAALLIAVAAAAPAAEKLEQPKVVVAVGGKSLFYYLPLTLAERLGYFKDEGLDVQIADFPGGAKALQAMVGGSADVVSGAFEHVVDMHAKGIEVQEFVLQDRYSGIVLGLTKAKAASYKSPKDLRGLKIGVTAPGSSTNIFVNALLARDGLAPDTVSIIGVGASSGAVAAVQKGQVEGISNLDPVITRLEKGGDIVAVVDTRTPKGMQEVYGGAYAAGCLYARTEFLRKNPNTAAAMASAMVRALLFLQKSTPDQVIATVPPEYYGDDKETYKAAFLKNKDGYSADGRMSIEAAEHVYKILDAFEPAVKGKKIDLKQTFDNRFVETALRKHK